MPRSLLVVSRLRVVDDGDKPVSILPEVEDHIPINIIGIPKHVANLGKILPPYRFNDCRPRSDFFCHVRIAIDGFL
jgi:hypothetical protein